MKQVYNIQTINEYNAIAGYTTLHPLISMIDFSQAVLPTKPRQQSKDISALSFGFYSIFLKEGKNCSIRYGANYYDYQEGTLLFIAPGQVVSIEEDGDDYQPSGYVLLFHPDLIRGTSLNNNMKNYHFFSYDVNEALHLSEPEKKIIMDCFKKIEYEIKHAIDQHSKKLIVTNIELLLDYCTRFYDRQFITRSHADTGITEKFERLLHDYFISDKPQAIGIPSVAFFANELHLSANYFGDVIKKETGRSAQEHIHDKLVSLAKDKMFEPGKSISEVAYSLGFKYPQHFTRFFKQHAGQTPNEYKSLLN